MGRSPEVRIQRFIVRGLLVCRLAVSAEVTLGLGVLSTCRLAYTRSPLEDSRLFGPSPWKILATTYEQKGS